ncbi:MAG: hypothetical protein ABFD97_21070 [Syntrophobacter sp.]
MAVKVQNFGKIKPVAPNRKQVSNTSTPSASQNTGLFEKFLSSLKGNSTTQVTKGAQKAESSHFQNRPTTATINNYGRNKPTASKTGQTTAKAGHSAAKAGQTSAPQNVNNMAASALISLAAVSSGSNRLNNYYSMGSGMSKLAAMQPRMNAAEGSAGAQGIGKLSAKFESGEKGPDVIGYDSSGGTSYGTFQISSKAGTMRQFIDYLSDNAPELAQRFKTAGPANTGSRSGKMPELWKKVATENPTRFSKLQTDFIEQTHYTPALKEVTERTGVDISQSSRALKEVLWSTAVQHGPNGAAKIFTKAINKAKGKNGGIQAAHLINSVYSMRAGQFGSSSPELRASLQNRFRQEGKIALAMLSEPFQNSDSMRV